MAYHPATWCCVYTRFAARENFSSFPRTAYSSRGGLLSFPWSRSWCLLDHVMSCHIINHGRVGRLLLVL